MFKYLNFKNGSFMIHALFKFLKKMKIKKFTFFQFLIFIKFLKS